MDYNILIGGEAGQGLNTITEILGKILLRSGYYIYSTKDYMSRVRGGHNFNQIRFSNNPIYSHKDSIDVLISLDEATIAFHNERLEKDGIILCSDEYEKDNDTYLGIKLKDILNKIGNKKVLGIVLVGAVIKLFDLSIEKARDTIRKSFKEKIIDINIEAIQEGYNSVDTLYRLEKPDTEDKILINGNQAIAIGALTAGCTFVSGYPMTPGTSVMTYLASKQKEYGIVVEQAEDEIAAINMIIGASFAGARSMTSTSGGGYSLMAEGIGLAGMTETPVVIVNSQRPGPATGLPTRTAQADLKSVINVSQDEYPSVVISVRNAEDAFYQTARAFNIADKYQIPVTILTDQYLADTEVSINPYDFNKISIERNLCTSFNKSNGKYKRYDITESGISPRLIPGNRFNQTFTADSDEHDEYGHIIESAEQRIKMMEKRMCKLEGIKQDIVEPWYIGAAKPDTLLVSWGSTYGAIKEAVMKLNEEGSNVGALIYGDVWPFPKNMITDYSKKVKEIISVECNYTGQLADIIQENTCIPISKRLNKYDGRQWSAGELYKKLNTIINGRLKEGR